MEETGLRGARRQRPGTEPHPMLPKSTHRESSGSLLARPAIFTLGGT